jgi:hypothetical protein
LADSHAQRLMKGENAVETATVGHVIAYDPIRHALLEGVLSEAQRLLKQKRLREANT